MYNTDVPVVTVAKFVLPSYIDADTNVYPPNVNDPVIPYVSKTLLNLSVANVLLNVAVGADGAVGVPNINLRTPSINVTAVLLSKSATSIPVNDCILFVTNCIAAVEAYEAVPSNDPVIPPLPLTYKLPVITALPENGNPVPPPPPPLSAYDAVTA